MGNRFGSDRTNLENDNRFLDREYSLGNGVTLERDYQHGFHAGYPDRVIAGRQYGESHYGRGPKGFKRNPDRIREDVCEALTRHEELDATRIDVIVKGSEIYLEGEVDERDDKWLAGDVADSTLGVDKVINNLKVLRTPTRQGSYNLSEKAAREARNTDLS